MSRLRFIASRSESLLASVLLIVVCGVAPVSSIANAAAPSSGGWQAASGHARAAERTSNVQWNQAPKRHSPEDSTPAAAPNSASASIAIKRIQHAATTANGDAARNKQSTDSRWRLPNATATLHSSTMGNPATAGTTREPREFQAPANAQPLNSDQAARRNAPPSFQLPGPAATVAQAPTANSRNMSLPASQRPTNSAQSGRSHTVHRRAPRHRTTKKSPPSLWDTITVAFEGAEQLAADPENLPLPGGAEKSMVESQDVHSETVPHSHGDGNYMTDDEHNYFGDPYCGDGVCESGCGCGCSGEVGCACEPGCGCATGDCGSRDVCCIDDGESCHSVQIRFPKWQELTVFGGVHGFKGPYDQARDSGNFGFHEGFNTGYKIPTTNAGYQIGYRAVHSQLNGDIDTNIADPHTQQFVTAGIFQRAKDGIQFGIVWDMLRDERWGAVDFHQFRGELSMIERGCHEIGVAVAMHLSDDEPFRATSQTSSVMFQPTDQYLLFYRLHGPRGGEGRFYGGFNDDDDGIIGADMLVPLHDRWSLATGFTYMIPAEHAGREGASQEAWNISTALVWHWDCRARKSHSNCYRPLFNVADNGSLIIDERLGAPATD